MQASVTLKPYKSFQEQLEILKARGLIIDDESKALGYLQTLGYYRFSGYFYPFRVIENGKRLDTFLPDTHFQTVKDLYMFDKKLRQLALDALERIEVAMRVQIVYQLAKRSQTAYLDANNFDKEFDHADWLYRFNKKLKDHKKNDFVKHNLEVYGVLPMWVACEIWDFGAMSKMYEGIQSTDKEKIASYFNFAGAKQLESLLKSFNFIRNISAHYSRLWNRIMVQKFSLKGDEFESDTNWQKFSVNRTFIYFCLMKRMLDILCPNSQWGNRFLEALEEFPACSNNAISLKDLGLTVSIEELKKWDLWK